MNLLLPVLLLCLSWASPSAIVPERVVTGDERLECYLPQLAGKRVALFSNHTGMCGERHVLDVLCEEGVDVTLIFSPEHGFSGKADAGQHVGSGREPDHGIPVSSLYNGRRPTPEEGDMQRFDVLLVDIQDVGLRFYTYYITMYHLMDACALHHKPVIVLDRPNPNGHCVDGPILDMRHRSGVGCLPIPVMHGMTLGELALMINGERWLPEGRTCPLTVIPCLNYTHQTRYRLPVAPSPNLPDMTAIYLYPSLCLFEGTPVSIGRGTDKPFRQYGHPDMKGYTHSFTPRSMPGATRPPCQDRLCYGRDLSDMGHGEIRRQGMDLTYLIEAYHNLNIGDRFFTPFFEKLIGVDYVRQMIEAGAGAEQIKARWENDVEQFRQQQRPYLLYE